MNPQQPPGYPHSPPQFPSQPPRPARRRRMWPWIVLTAVISLGVGGAVGGSGSSGPAHTVVEHDGLLTVTPSATVTVTAPAARPAARPASQGPGTTMGADGTAGIYVVGQDIKAGTWHTAGAVGGGSGNCYVALLSALSDSGGDDGNIITNDNVTGPDTITVGAGVKAVQVNGCETWHRTGP